MSRRRVIAKREILPDPKFGNLDVAKFMNVYEVYVGESKQHDKSPATRVAGLG